MTVGQLKELLAGFSDDTVLKIWHFDGPVSADSLKIGTFIPAEPAFEMPAKLCLRPVTDYEESF